ncbi:ParB and winged helix-turn-helix domain-containing protein [Actinomadura welshii]
MASFRAAPSGSGAILMAPDRSPTVKVPIKSLVAAGSPRLFGEDAEHVKTLSQAQEQLPPILVHRPTMRIIDGVHRVRAAELRGAHEIEARFFDGDEESAFLLAVHSNIAHGLPLTMADRTAAAARLLETHPSWSDRAVAQVVGLAHATVGTIRQRMTARSDQTSIRIGRDGRVRSLNTAAARRAAGVLLRANPNASLRDIANQTGISPATVRDVRNRLLRGDDPVPPKQREGGRKSHRVRDRRQHRAIPAEQAERPIEVWGRLCKDPSLRSTETGRSLLRWLAMHASSAEKWEHFIDDLPPHSIVLITEIARGMATTWNSFVDELEQRADADYEGTATADLKPSE